MLTTADILTIIGEKSLKNINQLAKEIEIPEGRLHVILVRLCQYNLIEYDSKTGKVALPRWLINLDKEIGKEKPAAGEIVLPRYKEIRIQDVLIGNYTGNDLELKLRLRAKSKEIAICTIT